MCTTCGCGAGESRIEGEHEHTVVHPDGTISSYRHTHEPAEAGHEHPPAHHHPHGPSHDHEHVHPDGTRHAHPHDHAHGVDHDHPHDAAAIGEHVRADGSRHAHPRQRSHGADHDHRYEAASHGHAHSDDSRHAHPHGHGEGHGHGHDHGPAHSHAPGLTPAQMVRIERDILGANNEIAARNRRRFEDAGIFALNLVSSPGAGKTTLLVETIRALGDELPLAVIEGDQQTSFDADRIRATGARAIQVNTGKGCHLDAAQIERALARLAPAEDSLLFIENVGNLVCPAAFDLGEAHKVVVLSVTEGEDKPLKYPDMFAAASLMLLNKIDLLPHLRFDVDRAVEYARRVRPGIEVLQISATTGAGMDAWLDWVRAGSRAARERRQATVAALRRRVAELEALVGRR
jgi:hydrogenase nickel incorporation protein HypB